MMHGTINTKYGVRYAGSHHVMKGFTLTVLFLSQMHTAAAYVCLKL